MTICFGHTAGLWKQNAADRIFSQCCRWNQLYWVRGSTSNINKSFLINRNWKSLQHQNDIKDWILLGKTHGICLAKLPLAIRHYNCVTFLFQMPISKWCSCMMWHTFTSFTGNLDQLQQHVLSTGWPQPVSRKTHKYLQFDCGTATLRSASTQNTYLETGIRNTPWQPQGTVILNFGVGSSGKSGSLQGIALESSSQVQRLQLHPLQLHNHMLMTLILGLNFVKDQLAWGFKPCFQR